MGKLVLIVMFSVSPLFADTIQTWDSNGNMTTTSRIGGSVYSYDSHGNYANSQQIGNTIHTWDNNGYSTQQYIRTTPPVIRSPESYQVQTVGNIDYVTGSHGYQGTGQRIGNNYYYNSNR